MKFSMNAPAQFHAGSIQPEYPVFGSESITNPYTQPVHVFSDPLLLTRTCPTIKSSKQSFIVPAGSQQHLPRAKTQAPQARKSLAQRANERSE
jgi:hypothetical protein